MAASHLGRTFGHKSRMMTAKYSSHVPECVQNSAAGREVNLFQVEKRLVWYERNTTMCCRHPSYSKHAFLA